MCSSGYIALRRQATRTPERSSSLHKSRRGVYHCTRSTRYLHSNAFKIHSYIPNHGFCYKRICVRPALLPFATGFTHSGAEFITAPEPERSSLHKRYPIDHLKCIPNTFLRPNHGFCQKKIYVFVRLYHPSLQATCTPERSSSLHKNRYGVHHCTK